jgi:hypothetical protein
MGIGKLILYSGITQPLLTDRQSLIESLKTMGLLGSLLNSKNELFLTGEKFLQLISFVGCSTSVCLTPNGSHDQEFCKLAVNGPLSQPLLIWDKNSRPPTCPKCKNPIENWKESIENSTLKCNQCGNESQLEEISWGKKAGYGRIFIEINNIFPGEARPVPDLLASLNRSTGTEWSYFYTS